MNIIIEGTDASGKSTLARAIQEVTRIPIQTSEGPPHSPTEMNDRIKRYLARLDPFIYDRHPCVSEAIYMRTRMEASTPLDPGLIDQFYQSRSLFIYCDPLDRGLEGHQTRPEVDTPDHLERLQKHYQMILGLYREWAISHAHILYRIGDDMSRVVDMVERALSRAE
jgi:hypothetical protein